MHQNKSHSGYCVLLCARNGAAYLDEQLESIVGQKMKPACVLFFDDGSVDATVEIARRFQDRLPLEFVHLIKQRDGAAGAFAAILCHAANAVPPYAAYLLCDQDDIWEANKAERLLSALDQTSANLPALVHSELRCFGPAAAGRDFLHVSLGHHKYQSFPNNPLRTLLFENIVVGASTAFNHALLRLAAPMPAGAFMHDWWLALSCVANNGSLIYVPEALTRYRIHGKSTVGRAGTLFDALPRRLAALRHRRADPWLDCVRLQLRTLPFGQKNLPTGCFEPLLGDALMMFDGKGVGQRLGAARRLFRQRIWSVSYKDLYYKLRLLTDYVI